MGDPLNHPETYDVGRMRERFEILSHEERASGFLWAPCRKTAGELLQLGKRVVYADSAKSVEGFEIILRRQALHRGFMLRCKGRTFVPTRVEEVERRFLRVEAGAVALVPCTAERPFPLGGRCFHAIRSEKYRRHEEAEPYSLNDLAEVLTVPRTVELQRGALVLVAGVPYEIQVVHDFDEHLCSYEILRREDL